MQHTTSPRFQSLAGARVSPQARQTEFLTPDEACDLVSRAQRGDVLARDRVVEAHLGLVVAIARRYATSRMPLADLVQEGTMGLLQAIPKFSPARGVRFSTYAGWWIWQAVSRAALCQGNIIRLPDRAALRLRQLRNLEARLWQEIGRQPTPAELAAGSGLSLADVTDLLAYHYDPASLDVALDDASGRSWAALTVAPPAEHESPLSSSVTRADVINELMRRLTAREQEVLSLRFGLRDGHPWVRHEIAHRLGISRERVRQVEQAALLKLRAWYAAWQDAPSSAS